MRPPHYVVAGMVFLLLACNATDPTTDPGRSIPPAPEPPPGWSSVGSLGGGARQAPAGATFTVRAGALAVNAACAGQGTLVIVVSPQGMDSTDAHAAPSAVFNCGDREQVGIARVQLPDAHGGEVTTTAYLIEGFGALRHPAFNASLEQPTSLAEAERH